MFNATIVRLASTPVKRAGQKIPCTHTTLCGILSLKQTSVHERA